MSNQSRQPEPQLTLNQFHKGTHFDIPDAEYRVIKIFNTTSYDIGEVMTRDQVDDAIESGVKVTITK